MDRYAAREIALLKTSELSHGARLLYFAIDNYQRDNAEAWPGQRTLVRDLGCSVRAVQRYLAELIESGLCAASRRGYGMSNSYVLHWRQQRRDYDDSPVASVTTDLARHKANQTLNPEEGASAEETRYIEIPADPNCSSCEGRGVVRQIHRGASVGVRCDCRKRQAG